MCRKAFARQGKPVPCEGCEYRRPFLMPENRDAWELWCQCSTQIRVTLAGAVGIDYNSMFRVAEALGIDVTPGVLKKVYALEAEMREEVK